MVLKNCDMRTFSERCMGKKLACYGIGNEFHRIMCNYADYEWQEAVCYLVDGNDAKAGEQVLVNGKRFAILPPEALPEMAMGDLVILVTSSEWLEIVEYLNRIGELNRVPCYLFHFMYSLSENREMSIRRRERPLIPPVIHYCWFGGGEKTDLHKKCIESWRSCCPGYEIREWNESNCDVEETLYTRQAYEAGKYGFVPDYFRLKILYENGGIYLDTDVELVKNPEDLRYNEAFCGMSYPGEVGLGLGFGAVRENQLIKYLAERYREMSFVNEDGTYNETGSPVYQTEDLMKIGMKCGNKVQTVRGMTMYPTEVLSPKNVWTGEINRSAYTYAIHHYDASWFSGEKARQKQERVRKYKIIRQMMESDRLLKQHG